MKYKRPVIERLLERVSHEPTSGCWLWDGWCTATGYALLNVKGRSPRAHRLMYEEVVGPIPDGMTVDHKCRVRCCINPEHLQLVSHAGNCALAKARNIALGKRCRKCGSPQVYAGTRKHPVWYCRSCKADYRAARKTALNP